LILLLSGCLPAEVRTVRPTPMGDGLVFVRGGGGNSVVLAHGRRALVFDPKTWPFERAVRDALREAGADAAWIVESHAHFDHVQAATEYTGAMLIASPFTAALAAHGSLSGALPRPPAVPSLPVRTRLTLDLGGEPAVVVALAPAHTGGDVALWLPARRVLATGDCFDAGFYPHVDPFIGGTMTGYLASLERLAAFDAEVVLPGHGPAATGRDLAAYRDWLRSLHDEVARARREGASRSQIVERLSPRGAETYEDLGLFSSRRAVVEALLDAPSEGIPEGRGRDVRSVP